MEARSVWRKWKEPVPYIFHIVETSRVESLVKEIESLHWSDKAAFTKFTHLLVRHRVDGRTYRQCSWGTRWEMKKPIEEKMNEIMALIPPTPEPTETEVADMFVQTIGPIVDLEAMLRLHGRSEEE